jgi:hypothetical protein
MLLRRGHSRIAFVFATRIGAFAPARDDAVRMYRRG